MTSFLWRRRGISAPVFFSSPLSRGAEAAFANLVKTKLILLVSAHENYQTSGQSGMDMNNKNSSEENASDKDFFAEDAEMACEFANISKRRIKGMSANITIKAKDYEKCGPRIRIQNSLHDKMESANMFEMTVPDAEISGTSDGLTSEDLAFFGSFVRKNEQVLTAYRNNGRCMFIADVIDALMPG
ncbi:hypothetical protein [Succinimonas sp.]|uniref:hypothetical protein n=1 Tax=Succinimonas sp. TaxID=1936151 RepID=UPI0038659FAF